MAETARRTGVLPQPIPFGNYVLLEKISTGGMAEIFKAKAFGVEGFERFVAVKRIRPSIAEDEEFIRMFINEAKLASQLQHANIAQIFELGRVGDDYFIAMEYVSGRDLRDLWDRARQQGQPLPPEVSAFVMMKVCEGLEYAHNKSDTSGTPLGIVHRDVSPQNILVSYEGTVKLVDFGVAKASNTSGHTQVGIVKGKLSYMSPEQVRGRPADRGSDTFAAGICLYELITGERLFLGNTDFETLEKIRRMEVVPPSLYNPHVPPDLEQLVLKALSPDQAERFSTAHDLGVALQRWLRERDLFLTSRDIAEVMSAYFGGELAEERRNNESFRTQSMPAVDLASAGAHALSWDDEESETAVFAKGEGKEQSERSIENFVPPSEDVVWARPKAESSRGGGTPPGRRVQTSGALPRVAEAPAAESPPGGWERLEEKPAAAPAAAAVPARPAPAARTTRDAPRVPERRSRGPLVAIALLTAILVGVLLFALFREGAPENAILSGLVEPPIAEFEVSIDGHPTTSGTGSFRIEDLPPGSVTVRLGADGFEPVERVVTLEPGLERQEAWQLQRLRQMVTLQVEPAEATLFINGEERGAPPLELRSEDVGSVFSLRVEAPDHLPHEARVRFDEVGSELTIALDPASLGIAVRAHPAGARFTVRDAEGETLASGTTPARADALPAEASLTLLIEADGHEPLTRTFVPGEIEGGMIEERLTPTRTAETRPTDSQPAPSDAHQPTPPPPTTAPRITVRNEPESQPARTERPRVTASSSRTEPTRTERPRVTGSAPTASPTPSPAPTPTPPPPTQQAQAAPSGPPGTLNIRSRHRARVFIDGQDTQRTTPLENFAIVPGTYRVRLVFDELGSERTFRVTIEPGRARTIMGDPD